MRKLLLFFAMLCVSIGTWATITISPDPNPYNNTWIGTEQISNSQIFTISGWDTPGDVAKLLNGDASLNVNWNGQSLSDLKSAVIIRIGAGASTDLLNDDDLEALELLTSTKYLDIDGSSIASGANINKIKIGSAVESVVLPNGLSKSQVNSVAAILSNNENFGSCLSKTPEVTVTPVTNYYYTAGSNSGQKVVESATVTLDKENLKATVKENVRVELTPVEGYPKYKYTNTWNNNKDVYFEGTDIEQYEEYGQTKYRIKPNPLEVDVKKHLYDSNNNDRTNDAQQDETGYYVTTYNPNAKIIVYREDGKDGYYNDPECTDRNWNASNVQQDESGNYYYIGGANVKEYLTEGYTYYNPKEYRDVAYSGPTPTVNSDGSLTGSIENSSEYFEVTIGYKYTYELDGKIEEYPTNSEDADLKLDTTHDVVYSVEARVEEETTSADNVVAYVKTAGTLYKATSLAEVRGVPLNKITISGNLTLGDIANTSNGGDPGQASMVTAQYTETTTNPAWFNNDPANAKEIDLSDAKIDNSEYLRQISQYTNLETLTFPKDCENIPDACCYSNGNNVYKLKNITFPDNMKTIGKYAFAGISLEELLLPSALTSVGEFAFYNNKNLENVEMESLIGSCTFGPSAFASSGVKHVTLSEGVDGISTNMFAQCGSLESIRIPTTAETIHAGAFADCISLHKLVIPEGVLLMEKNIFNGGGLTDIYVMATTESMVPRIYCLEPDGSGEGTFTKKNILGNNTSPNKKKENGDFDENTTEEDALSWYQEEFSDMDFGIGGNNCMIQLHYPESMSSFYNGTDNLPFGWESNIASTKDREIFAYEMEKARAVGTLSTIYAYGSREYDKEKHANKGDSDIELGPTAGGLYWPNQQDYLVRLAAGYTSSGQPTAEAWRQIPLQGIALADDFTFTKKYDDTWYTMCFPWDMDDNTLFGTFNQKCEIVEFKGAEMVKQDDLNYNLVFHFDDVAETHYMNEDHSKEYERIESEYTRTVEVQKNGATISKKYYTYKNIETGDLVYWPYDLTSADGKAMQKEYNNILHLMVFAGHPYMIHPSIGAKAGQPKDCTIAGVKKVEGDNETLTALAESQKQTRIVAELTTPGEPGASAWVSPDGKTGGSYTFIGNINDEVDGDKGMKNMPLPCYFLGVKNGSFWPMYYRKSTGDAKKWSQYSAIIVPDELAKANIEDHMGSGTSAGAKEIVFGDWEIVDEDQMTTVIDNAVIEGKEKNEPAQIKHMDVVYNIKGQVIRSNSSSVEGLPKGLYIVNGKKYMVK